MSFRKVSEVSKGFLRAAYALRRVSRGFPGVFQGVQCASGGLEWS